MKNKIGYAVYRVVRALCWTFSPKYRFKGEENLPDEPCVIVGNHSHMYGPIASEVFMTRPHYVWCAGEMMNAKEVQAYAFRDFWSHKPAWIRWFYYILSYLIVPLSVAVFSNALTVAVYHDQRLIRTFKDSMKRLDEGADLVILPESYTPYNNIVYRFQEHYIDLAKLYYKKTGRALSFVPMYIAPALSEIHFGEPVRFDPQADIDSERKRINNELMDRISAIASSLPEHTVVPYPNVAKKYYKKNVPLEVAADA